MQLVDTNCVTTEEELAGKITVFIWLDRGISDGEKYEIELG